MHLICAIQETSARSATSATRTTTGTVKWSSAPPATPGYMLNARVSLDIEKNCEGESLYRKNCKGESLYRKIYARVTHNIK